MLLITGINSLGVESMLPILNAYLGKVIVRVPFRSNFFSVANLLYRKMSFLIEP